MIITIIGWTVLIASWFTHKFIDDEQMAQYVKNILSAFALGWFTCSLLIKYLAL
jgi:hypothetical protein